MVSGENVKNTMDRQKNRGGFQESNGNGKLIKKLDNNSKNFRTFYEEK